MAVRQQQRRGTAAQWTSSNPILSAAEIGYETDTNKFKIGDGTNRWANLSYFVDLDTMIAGAPGLLNSLDEIAAAINDDPTFFTTIASSMSSKAPIASPTFTGTVSGVTKSMVGLGSVDNTADTAKPVSTAQATAIATAKTAAEATASADATSKANAAQSAAATDATSKANAAQSAAEATASADATSKANAAKTYADGLIATEVTNRNSAITTASTTTQTALDLKAPLASPALTGTPTAPTAATGTDTTQVATTAFVKAAIQDISSLNLVLDGGGV
jgi:hypothetical protein